LPRFGELWASYNPPWVRWLAVTVRQGAAGVARSLFWTLVAVLLVGHAASAGVGFGLTVSGQLFVYLKGQGGSTILSEPAQWLAVLWLRLADHAPGRAGPWTWAPGVGPLTVFALPFWVFARVPGGARGAPRVAWLIRDLLVPGWILWAAAAMPLAAVASAAGASPVCRHAGDAAAWALVAAATLLVGAGLGLRLNAHPCVAAGLVVAYGASVHWASAAPLLPIELRDWVFVSGHSVGGALGAAMCLTHPQGTDRRPVVPARQ
jgi:hypothetical protein